MTDPARPLQGYQGEPWVVLRMPSRLTVPWFDLIEACYWLRGWTPIEHGEAGGRKALLPGTAFVPLILLNQAAYDAQSAGIIGVEPAFFNDNIMIVGEDNLAELRQIEIDLNTKPELREEPQVLLKIGMEVEIKGHWFEGKRGIIKRLDSENAHLDVPGMTSRMTVKRYLLQPI